MATHRRSLQGAYPRHFEVPLLMLCAIAALFAGLSMPVIAFEQLVFWKDSYSVLGGIQNLYLEKQYALAAIILLFSAIFPVVKLLALGFLWFRPYSDEKRLKVLGWVERMGKWSMVDVFVLAIIIVLTKTTPMTKAEPRVGLYVFASSVILSMLTAIRIKTLAKKI